MENAAWGVLLHFAETEGHLARRVLHARRVRRRRGIHRRPQRGSRRLFLSAQLHQAIATIRALRQAIEPTMGRPRPSEPNHARPTSDMRMGNIAKEICGSVDARRRAYAWP